MRIAIHTDSAHEHPHLHHHILWAVFAMIVFMFLFVRGVAGEAMTTTSGTMPALDAVQDSGRVSVVGTVRIYRVGDFERDYLSYREWDFR